MMKRAIAIVIGVLIVLTVGYKVAVRGLSYEVSGYRTYDEQLDKQHLHEMNYRFDYAYDANEKDLRRFAMNNTTFELDFAMRKSGMTNPNSILDGKQGHCKMYSCVMASTFNQLAKLKKLEASCRVAYGHVFLYGVNLHQFFSSGFFRDHDFCVIKDKSGVHAADALMYDYFMIDQIRVRR